MHQENVGKNYCLQHGLLWGEPGTSPVGQKWLEPQKEGGLGFLRWWGSGCVAKILMYSWALGGWKSHTSGRCWRGLSRSLPRRRVRGKGSVMGSKSCWQLNIKSQIMLSISVSIASWNLCSVLGMQVCMDWILQNVLFSFVVKKKKKKKEKKFESLKTRTQKLLNRLH